LFESFTFLVIVGLSVGGIILGWVMYDAIFSFSELPDRIPKDGLVTEVARDKIWGRMIQTKPDCCDAVKQYIGKVYPISVAPTLPVSGCHLSACTCIYVPAKERRYHERRAGQDRRKIIRYDLTHPDRRDGERRKNWPPR